MKKRKLIAIICALTLSAPYITAVSAHTRQTDVTLFAASTISGETELANALSSGGDYSLTANVSTKNSGVNEQITTGTIDGGGFTIKKSNDMWNDAVLYQNSASNWTFKNMIIDGNKTLGTFSDAALWYMSGTAVFENVTVQNFKTAKTDRFAMTCAGADITLNNVEFRGNENSAQSVFAENPGVNIQSGTLTLKGSTKANVYYTGGTINVSGLTEGCQVYITADSQENFSKLAALSCTDTSVVKSANPYTKTVSFAMTAEKISVADKKAVHKDNKIEVTATIVNPTLADKDTDIIAAAYANDGSICALNKISKTLEKSSFCSVPLTLDFCECAKISVFVWDSKLSPITKSTEINRIQNHDVIYSFDFDNYTEDVIPMLKNGAVIKENRGIDGSAVVLDGNGAYMQLDDNILTPEMTFMAWVKTDTDQTWARLFDFGADTDNYFFYSPNGGRIELNVNANRSTLDVDKFNDTGIWVHYAVTKSKDKVQLYRNGTLIADGACAGDISALSQGSNYIGKSHYENDKLFCGAMDNIVMYSRVCTADEIKAAYDQYAQKLDNENAYKDYSTLNINAHLTSDDTLPLTGNAGSTITWLSDTDGILAENGGINAPSAKEADQRVTLTAQIKRGAAQYTKTFDVTVLAEASVTGLTDYAMSNVKMTNEYLINGETKMTEYLKKFDVDRSVEGFRRTAEIGKGVSTYGGWETSLIAGHAIGHYVSALAQGVEYSKADTLDDELLAKSQAMIDALYGAQIKGDCVISENRLKKGFLFATTNAWGNGSIVSGEGQFDNVESNKTNITTQAWVPWYTMHKILAGLIDTYKFTKNEKALEMASLLGDWVYNRVGSYDSAMQARVLNIEYGGMNDCLYELYKLTGKAEHAKAAHMFDEIPLFDEIYAHNDVLADKHANTTIPKIIGALNRYRTNAETDGKLLTDSADSREIDYYLTVAENFWDIVVNDHSYITGGNSENEHFRNAHTENAYRNNINCETCNTYNMLKLSRELYKITGDKKYADYYESTFLNAIVSSQNPETGMTMYFQPMATGYHKVFSSEFDDFWCCTGSGMESFTKLTDSIYYKKENTIVVNQYISSVLTDTDNNIRLTQESSLPDGETTTVKVEPLTGSKQRTAVILRVPEWTAAAPTVKLNGTAVEYMQSAGFITIERDWSAGDTLEITLPMQMKAYSLADSDTVTAFKYGPTVLSVGLGNSDMSEKSHGMAVRVPSAKADVNEYITVNSDYGTREKWLNNLNENMVKTDGKLEFTLKNTDQSLVFTPHYKRYNERYGIYWYITGNDENKMQEIVLSDKLAGRDKNIVIDSIEPSHDQQENGHGYTQSGSVGVEGTADMANYRAISKGGYVDYQMAVDKNVSNYLEVTYAAEDAGKKMNIYAGDTLIAEVTASGTSETVRYPLSPEVMEKAYTVEDETLSISGCTALHIVFKAEYDTDAPKLCGSVRIVKDYSRNPNLSALTFSGGVCEPEFNPDTTEYVLKVDSGAKAVTVKTVPADKYGLVYINGILINDAVEKTIDTSVKTLEIKSLAEDHSTQKVYTVTIE